MKKLLSLSLLLLTCSVASAALIFQAGNPTDYIRTSNVTGAPTTYPMALAMVGKVTASNAIRRLLQVGPDGAGTGYVWSVIANDTLEFYRQSATSSTSTTAMTTAEGVWCFIGISSASASSHRWFVYNYATRTIVMNETTTFNFGAIGAPTNYLTIGGLDVSGTVQTSGGFDGTMSWIAVYARDFTGANGDYFKNIAHLGPYIHGAPVRLYTFNEMTGTTVRNRTSISDDGTMTNFQASPWTTQGLPRPISW